MTALLLTASVFVALLLARALTFSYRHLSARRDHRDLETWRTKHRVGYRYIEGMEKPDVALRDAAVVRRMRERIDEGQRALNLLAPEKTARRLKVANG